MTVSEALACYLRKDFSPMRYDSEIKEVFVALKFDIKDIADYLKEFDLENESTELAEFSEELVKNLVKQNITEMGKENPEEIEGESK